MCTFKNEYAVVVSKINKFSDNNVDVADEKFASLLGRQVTLVGGNVDEDDSFIESEEGGLVVSIHLGRFANSVLKEVFAEEIEKGLIVVSANEEDAHKKIKEYFPDNRYEFLNEKIVFDEGFMQQPEKPSCDNNI